MTHTIAAFAVCLLATTISFAAASQAPVAQPPVVAEASAAR